MCCFRIFSRKKRQLNSTDSIEKEVILVSVMYKVRSFSPLTKQELDFVKKLPKEKIDEIIDIFNSHAFTLMDIYETEMPSCSQGINFSQRC